MTDITLEILREQKLRQAQNLLRRLDLPAWVLVQHAPIFTLSHIGRDPAVTLLCAPPAFEFAIYVVTPDSAHIFYDHQLPQTETGLWQAKQVRNPLQALKALLDERNIQRIAINTDPLDPRNDGLTASLKQSLLAETQRAVCSASDLLITLWQVKTQAEIVALKNAQSETAAALKELSTALQIGWTHSEIAKWLRCWGASHNYTPGWASDWVVPPIVGFGSPMLRCTSVTPGHTMYVDYSFLVDGFCSDLQRTYYILPSAEERVPSVVERAFTIGMETLDQLREACKPGVRGYELYELGLSLMERAGYTLAFPHLGHPIGRSVNVTGALLEPHLPGTARAESVILRGEVYALGLRFWSAENDSHVIGVEEVIHVAETSTVYLSPIQTAVWPVAFSPEVIR